MEKYKVKSFQDFVNEDYKTMLEMNESHVSLGDRVKIVGEDVPENLMGMEGQVTNYYMGKYTVQFDSPVQIEGIDDVLQNYEFNDIQIEKVGDFMI